MALEVEAGFDRLSALMRFRTSTVFEMLVSLQSILDDYHFPDWTSTVRGELGNAFVKELTMLYAMDQNGVCISELGIAAPNLDDVPSFLDAVAAMNEREFTFYMLGRVFRREEIAMPFTVEVADQMAEQATNTVGCQIPRPTGAWAEAPLRFRDELVSAWRRYWQDLFKEHAGDHVDAAEKSIAEKRALVEQAGAQVVYKQLSGKNDLPPEIPGDEPYHEIVLIPAYRIPRRRIIYYGEGNVTVIYDCMRTDEVERDIASAKDDAVVRMRALADDTRLRILKVIAHGPLKANGRIIAEELKLSPSVVSRHLKQLKEAKIIEEHSPDNRNITYHLVPDGIQKIAEGILDFVRD